MHLDNHDFYGHPRMTRIPFGLIAAILFALMLIGAMAWSESDMAADYTARQIAAEQCRLNGLSCETEARPRKPKTCGVMVASKTATLVLSVLAKEPK